MRPETEEIVMMLPLDFWRKGRAAFTREWVPIMSVSNALRQSAGSSPITSADTLATTTSILPELAAALLSTQVATLEGCETSTTEPWARSELWAVDRSASVRLQKWTVAPSARKDCTIALPMDLVPPGKVG